MRTTGTENILVFDGAPGGMNVSATLAELLKEKAPVVSERVDQELLPKWPRQRGLQAETALN